MKNKPLLYQAKVLDTNDPLMLGRVRAQVQPIDDKALRVSQNFDETKDAWTERDPYIFKPLLPYFIYQVPLVDELIMCLYYNNEYKYQNQYYIQSTISSPVNSTNDEIVSSQRTTGVGVQFKPALILKNYENPLSGTPLHYGVFPEPGDNALLGRGRADLILKENEILLRAAKTTTKLEPGTLPTGNISRSFVQLSEFERIKKKSGVKQFINFVTNVVLVNYLIEWVVFNPYNSQDAFSGQIYLFKLKPDVRTNSENLKVDSQIDDLKSLVMVEDFIGLTLNQVANYINNFINKCNSGFRLNGKQVFSFTESQFPIFYRPTNKMYEIIDNPPLSNSPSDVKQSENLKELNEKISLYPNANPQGNGWGLIWKQNQVGKPFNTVNNKEELYEFDGRPTTFGTMGGDYLVFLSHLSEIPGKSLINLQNTLYGIDSEKFSDEILPNTSSMVRGEELLELLNKIVYFLVSHTHSFPLLPPDEDTYTDSNIPDLLSDLNNASSKILNKYIRIN